MRMPPMFIGSHSQVALKPRSHSHVLRMFWIKSRLQYVEHGFAETKPLHFFVYTQQAAFEAGAVMSAEDVNVSTRIKGDCQTA